MNLRLQQTVKHFYSSDSDDLSETKCSLCLVVAFYVHSVECVKDVWGLEELIIGLGKFNLILLTEWQEESYQCWRWCDLSSNALLKLVLSHNSSACFGPGSVFGIANAYWLDGRGYRWGQDFPQLFRLDLRPMQTPVQWIPGLSSGVICGRGVMLTPHLLLLPSCPMKA